MRRFFILDKFNTWYDWRLTLTAKDTTDPEPKTNYVELDGMSGTLDLSEALTGEVVYSDRTVTASFWTSEGTREDRDAMLRTVTAALHGKKVRIVEPDDHDHFFVGRVKIKNVQRSLVHVAFDIEAVCDPWRYAAHETERQVAVNGLASVVINNNGVKSLTPTLTVTGSVAVTCNGVTSELTAGSYKITDLRLRQGVNVVDMDGSGSVTFTYREACL